MNLLSKNMQKEFLKLMNESVAKDIFKILTLIKFWLKMNETYPIISAVMNC